MSLEAAVVARAVAHTGLNDLIAGRIYADVAPQEPTVPYLTFQVISAQRQRTFGKRAQLVRARVQIDAYEDNKDDLITLVTEVIDAFDNVTFGIVTDCSLEDERSLTELLGAEGQLYRHSIDVMAWYTNPAFS
jgi:hypothetical protein